MSTVLRFHSAGGRLQVDIIPDTDLCSIQQLIRDFLATRLLNQEAVNVLRVLESGNLYSLERGAANPAVRRRFGSNDIDYPHLITTNVWKEAMTVDRATQLLLADSIASRKPIKFVPAKSTDQTTREAAAALLLKTSDPYYTESGMIFSLKSPSLQALYRIDQTLASRNDIIRIDTWEANIAPCSRLVDLHHDDALTVTTLISGRKLWFIYPPTPRNQQLLTSAYANGSTTRFLDTHTLLEGGVVRLQRPGETIRLPPHCPHAVFTLETSILGGQEVYTVEYFPTRIRSLRLYVAYEEGIAKGGRAAKNAMAREIAGHLEKVLAVSEQSANEGLLEAVYIAWDMGRDAFRDCTLGDEGTRKKALRTWRKRLEGCGLESCPIYPYCSWALPIKARSRMREGALARHFEDVHF